MSNPTFSKPPEHRSYIHTQCGQVTTVDGDDYLGLCDPMQLWLGLLPQRTMCVHCRKTGPLNEFVWEETKETLASYRSRLRKTIPMVVRWAVYVLRFSLLVFLPCAGFWLGRSVSGTVLAIVGAIVGLFAGMLAVGMQMMMGDRDWRKFR